LREFWRVEAWPTAGHIIPDTKLWITRYHALPLHAMLHGVDRTPMRVALL
jgi:hypothetical protein